MTLTELRFQAGNDGYVLIRRTDLNDLGVSFDEDEILIKIIDEESNTGAVLKAVIKDDKTGVDKIDEEINNNKIILGELKEHWLKEKNIIHKTKLIKEKIEKLKIEAKDAEKNADYATVARIRHGEIIKSQQELQSLNDELNSVQKDKIILKEEVDSEDVANIVSKWTGIPLTRMLESEQKKLLKMEDKLKYRVLGQDKALSVVSNAVRRARAGLNNNKKPIGSFMFLGPTGVGKTETAKSLAEFLFNDENAMLRIDMSEYMEKHSVAKLIGSPPGYIGYDDGAYLTEKIRKNPYSVILFDEIEKAHSDVLNILLQITDDGRCTDSHGRTVSFNNTVIILTSNVGSHYITMQNDTNTKEIHKKIMDELRTIFKPEFLNRLDDIIIFENLKDEDICKIIEMQLVVLTKILSEKNIYLDWSVELIKYIQKQIFELNYGARPIKRIIQKKIYNLLAEDILSGKIKQGDKVCISVKNGAIDLEKAK